ncbi:hypothetical protein [Pleurocapsa sp. PCC 7319]|uniref:hypothetical protein n=1 Tax=Pleurocapsa sp. PCC 7319 TaxID=118161 RepID=UPI000349E483|nr:hypothetical protein [Pleurocapsa sp. PCC 7319]
MLTYPEESLKVKKISAEEQKKQERMRDVTMLLQQMVEREEVALKLIIDCLIDVGSINYANHKLQNPSLNKIMKVLVGYIKPVARLIALRWLKKNLPDLLTAWLESKVSFKPVPINEEEAVTGELETVPNNQSNNRG